MSTEKQCIEALEEMEAIYHNGDTSYSGLKYFKESMKKIEQLINEHFNNPPLKFEDLKEGMWVFDTYDNKYKKIDKLEDLEIISFYYNEDWVFYDDNRFYDREVKEDD